jgi:hypothetical protein
VIAGELAGVIAGPEDQVISLRDGRQFLVVLSGRHYQAFVVYTGSQSGFFIFDPSGVGVKQ